MNLIGSHPASQNRGDGDERCDHMRARFALACWNVGPRLRVPERENLDEELVAGPCQFCVQVVWISVVIRVGVIIRHECSSMWWSTQCVTLDVAWT
jgi:hypothetical protein